MITNDWTKICEFGTCQKNSLSDIIKPGDFRWQSGKRATLVISLQTNGTLEAQIWCESQKQIAKVLKDNEQEVEKQDVTDGTCIGTN